LWRLESIHRKPAGGRVGIGVVRCDAVAVQGDNL
jgi:hypothetical protein